MNVSLDHVQRNGAAPNAEYLARVSNHTDRQLLGVKVEYLGEVGFVLGKDQDDDWWVYFPKDSSPWGSVVCKEELRFSDKRCINCLKKLAHRSIKCDFCGEVQNAAIQRA